VDSLDLLDHNEQMAWLSEQAKEEEKDEDLERRPRKKR
jgi:hypothetical protein